MIRKSFLALAAVAALGVAALAPTAASAHYWHHYWGPRVGLYVGPGAYDSCLRKQWVGTPYGPRLRWVNVCY
jgi:hypothetical protein